MIRRLPIFLLAAGLGSCASYERAGPPAPIVSATTPVVEPKGAESVAQARPEEKVEVYAYRPPSSAPDSSSLPGPGAVPAEAADAQDKGPISESATSPAVESKESSTYSPTETTPTPAPAQTVVAYAPPAPPAPSLSPAADSLIKQAEKQRQARDYVGAAATLERALGIQPQEPYIWNRLARVRMEQGLYAQAGNLASRSNVLAGNQVALKQDNWGIIAAARGAVGDTAGAMEAERKARGE